ncbi:hypothetical protein G5T42_17195 [Microbacterium sp. 4R-513]|uniref:DUF11 domain-containing protein n=1 Tax=Microbacterium sp. 4R-513 TaxID=2567934 RepID=UPI0013E1EC68|nr:DUF11 domain-containing protein [Microbacterium sp. 4R-513]QIG40995.1 hypothetical protein G5T42_17195 [Microbacterium sp. 4R-513]
MTTALMLAGAPAAHAAPPSNDNIANAVSVSLPFSVTGSNVDATTENPDGFVAYVCNGEVYSTLTDVWYKLTVGTSQNVELSTEGSDFDTVLGVYTSYTGTQSPQVACDNDQPDGQTWSSVSFAATAGTTYYIAVGGSAVTSTPDAGSYVLTGSGDGPTGADLGLSVTDSTDPATVGSPYTYTATVANASGEAASGVSSTTFFSGPVTVNTASSSQGSCTVSAGTVTCALGTVPGSGAATVTIGVTPTAPGTVTASSKVSATTADPNQANNSDTESTTVNAPPGADLGVSVAESVDPVALGSSFTYTATVTNATATTSNGASVQTVVTGPGTVDSASSSQGSCAVSAGTVTCALGTVAASGSATVTIGVTPSGVGTVTAASTVSATTPDPNPGNNADTESTTVNNSLGCTIIGTPGNDTLNGTNGADVICGLGGSDTINGGNGNDTLYGGTGNDTIDGGNSDDVLHGGDGDDILGGGNGSDVLYGEAGNDTNYGETFLGSLLYLFDNGDDTIYGGSGNDDLDGQKGNDILVDTEGTDVMTGGAGNDSVNVQDGAGGDTANGGLGSDTCAIDAGDTSSSC